MTILSHRAFDRILMAGILAWLIAFAVVDVRATRKLHALESRIALKNRELDTHAAVDREVLSYQAAKEELEQRIKAINTLKQKQSTVTGAIGMITTSKIDAEERVDRIEINAGTVLISGHDASPREIDLLSRRVHGSQKRSTPGTGAFTLEVKR